MKRITVLLVDDNRVVRKEYRRILELETDLKVVGEAKNGLEAVAMTTKLQPAIVLMDAAMPRLNGMEATRQILQTTPATKVLMLSAHSEEAYVEAAVNSGAMGYLVKQTSTSNVGDAIREVNQGSQYFSPTIPQRLYRRKRPVRPKAEGECF